MAELPKVAGFGSCRAISALVKAHRAERLDLVNYDQRWYTHTTPEVLQKLEILRGEKAISEDAAPIVIDANSLSGGGDAASYLSKGDFRPDYFDKVDVAVVEICTARVYMIGRLALHATTLHKSPMLKRQDLSMRWMTQEEVAAGALKIAAQFPATIFQCHIERAPEGVANANRRRLNDTVRALADGKRIHVFDPDLYLDSYGIEAAVQDLDHFTPAFESFLSLRISEKVKDVMREAVR